MNKNKNNDLLFYLIGLRLFPGSPNWIMNITFPHINVNKSMFCLTVFVGLIPWNFITCSAGAMLSKLTSTKEIMNYETYSIVI